MSAVSKNVIPASSAARNKPVVSARVALWKTPPIRAQPKPSTDTLRGVLPNRRYRMLPRVRAQLITSEVICQPVGSTCGECHRCERRVLFDRGGEAARVHDRDIGHLVQAIPSV